MRLVTIKAEKLKKYTVDSEMMHNARRPSVLIAKLKYKGRNYTFAVPIRSNIAPSAPKGSYFPLPTRFTTKDNHRHGIHYVKMFPVTKDMVEVCHTENNMFASIIKATIDKSEKRIIKECQEYLNNYEDGRVLKYATNIDKLLGVLQENSEEKHS